MPKLKVFITVKTYPIPSQKYDELVCTAGITENGDFVRLYPINFRDLPFSDKYKKYQWVEVEAEKHQGRDVRKESYRPKEGTLRVLGEQIRTKSGDWSERASIVLQNKSRSLEELKDWKEADNTSLGIFKPKEVTDLIIKPDDADWKPQFKEALRQQRLWDNRKQTKEPPRKVPWKFQYRFTCDDSRCSGHQMMVEDWEVGQLYWNCVDRGATPEEAAQKVKEKFLGQICAPDRDTHFFVGTVLGYGTWVVIGVFWPKKQADDPMPLFQGNW